jgi:hypothetical protein
MHYFRRIWIHYEIVDSPHHVVYTSMYQFSRKIDLFPRALAYPRRFTCQSIQVFHIHNRLSRGARKGETEHVRIVA